MLWIKGTHENYSNIKREALGLVWELERLHYFIYGKQCTIQTDHKPLEAIFRKELSSCPAKLQRFVLGALKYNVKVTYVKGTDVPIADALSRVSLQPAAANSQLPAVLRYFDPAEETVIQADASLKGHGAILLQNGQPVCYGSKVLTKITVTLSVKH